MTDEQNGSARRGGDRPNRRDFLKAAGFGAALLGTGAGLAGCGSSPTTTASAQADGKPKYGGTLRAGVTGGGSTDTLNPFLIDTSPDIARCFALYEPPDVHERGRRSTPTNWHKSSRPTPTQRCGRCDSTRGSSSMTARA